MRINRDTIEAADAYLKVLDVDTFTDLIWQLMQSEDIEFFRGCRFNAFPHRNSDSAHSAGPS